MSERSLPYVIHSDEECQRLEVQARLANIQRHLRHLPISANDRVLDVGCGSGSMARLIARSFPQAEVVGVDLREQYLEFAEARARDEGLQNLTFRHGDVFALPFPDASFDVVWTKYLLHCFQEKPIISRNRSASELFSKSALRARRGHSELSKWKRPCHYRKSNSDVLMVQTCRSRKIPSMRRRDRRRDCPDFHLRASTLYASCCDESRSNLPA